MYGVTTLYEMLFLLSDDINSAVNRNLVCVIDN